MPNAKPKVLKEAEKAARKVDISDPTPVEPTQEQKDAKVADFKARVDKFMAEYIPLTQKHGLDFAPMLLPTQNEINGQKFTIPNSMSAQLQVIDVQKVAPKKKR